MPVYLWILNLLSGMVSPENDPKGSCAAGYQGTLCADCAVGYSESNDFECGECPDPLWNAIRLALIMFAVILLIVLMVRSTLAGAVQRKNVNSVYLKIMMNHVQLIMLTASFNFDWPERVLAMFETTEPVAQTSKQVLSFDCFIDLRSKATSKIIVQVKEMYQMEMQATNISGFTIKKW